MYGRVTVCTYHVRTMQDDISSFIISHQPAAIMGAAKLCRSVGEDAAVKHVLIES